MGLPPSMAFAQQVTAPAARTPHGGWRAAQIGGLVATAGVVAGLVVDPQFTLPVFWNVVIPLVPALLLISPALWRGVCPLATVSLIARPTIEGRRMTPRTIAMANAAGMIALVLLVPARRFLLDGSGVAVAALVAILGVAAVMIGRRYAAKSGFCNAMCPLLPVERLYGHRPMLVLENPRCTSCNLCTQRGCLDLRATKSVAQTLGPRRRTWRWPGTPFGLFAAAFPGLIVGFFTLSDTPFTGLFDVYGHVAVWMAASVGITGVAARLTGASGDRAVTVLAAASAALYYWFALPGLITTLNGPAQAVPILRGMAGILIAVWLWRSVFHPPAKEPQPHFVRAARR